jgi:23S rRNA pseudouridine2605 synthase
MRDKPHPSHKLEWPGGVVPEWAKPAQNLKRRGGKLVKGRERQGGSSPSKRERLQKIMAQSGHGSRRNIEILIAQGHITINGQVAKLGDAVGPGDKVKMDGHLLRLRFGEALPRVLLYHKPEGEIVTRDDPEGRATVFEKLPKVTGGRWVSVGRLDLLTGGLLIFTTSGELANRLSHPRFEVEREYAVRIMGELTEEISKQLLTGVDIDGESCKFDSIEDRGGEGSNHWYHVVLREGKNREVRKMCEAVGLMVSRLMRVRFGEITLPTFLKRSMMKELNEEEVQVLLGFAGMGEPLPSEDGVSEPVEDEHDSIGNREQHAGKREREIDESRDNIGNRWEAASKGHPHRDSEDFGNRADPRHAAPPVHDESRDNIGNRDHGGGQRDNTKRGDVGNRGEYGRGGDVGNRPPKPGQRRPQQGGAKPFFNKKRGPGPQGQPKQHGQGQQGQGQGQGEGQAQGQPRPHQQRRKHGKPPGPHGQGQGMAAAPVAGQAQGAPGPAAGPGGPKPGRNRRNKNRNRSRGAGEGKAKAEPQSGNSGNRDPL